MIEYKVSYCLGDFLHGYVLKARNEAEAIQKVINRIPHPEIMHDFKIEKYVPEWN